ncbi:procathepsin L-like [Planococcus citri]|uniref:procathepsin L-like n=1 Tax=Planococcus citri TaxID=170843 RepID=UPI0031F76BCA
MRWQFLFRMSIFCLTFIEANPTFGLTFFVKVNPSLQDQKDHQWEQYKIEFHKNYGSVTEENHRREIYERNVQQINQHNELFAKGEVSFKKEIDQYTDMDYTTELDWRKENAVTIVRDQKDCEYGDWAFAAIGAVEGFLSIRDKKLSPKLSVQELIDCTQIMGNYGCQRGTVQEALNYIKQYGISKETSYPFIGQDGDKCSNKQQDKIAQGLDINLDFIPKNDESLMKSYLYKNGPLLAVINDSPSFKGYNGGIYKDEECGKSAGEHNVLIVGYNEEKGEKYWIVKNSWGEDWGDKGYIKIARDKNICGIANDARFLSFNN